jgi:hypothetical protein
VTDPKADSGKPESVDLSSPGGELSDAELASVAGGVVSEAPAAIDLYASTDLLSF